MGTLFLGVGGGRRALPTPVLTQFPATKVGARVLASPPAAMFHMKGLCALFALLVVRTDADWIGEAFDLVETSHRKIMVPVIEASELSVQTLVVQEVEVALMDADHAAQLCLNALVADPPVAKGPAQTKAELDYGTTVCDMLLSVSDAINLIVSEMNKCLKSKTSMELELLDFLQSRFEMCLQMLARSSEQNRVADFIKWAGYHANWRTSRIRRDH